MKNHHVYIYQDTHLILHTSLVQYVVTLTLTSTCSFEKGTSPNSLFVRCGCSLCFSCAISGFQFILYLYLNYTPKHIPSHIYSTVLVIELLGPQLSYTNVNPKLKQYSVILWTVCQKQSHFFHFNHPISEKDTCHKVGKPSISTASFPTNSTTS